MKILNSKECNLISGGLSNQKFNAFKCEYQDFKTALYLLFNNTSLDIKKLKDELHDFKNEMELIKPLI